MRSAAAPRDCDVAGYSRETVSSLEGGRTALRASAAMPPRRLVEVYGLVQCAAKGYAPTNTGGAGDVREVILR